MGNNLKFNSSVCTSIVQSQRLLDLGLKPETADMLILPLPNGKELITQNIADESGILQYKIKGEQWESSHAWSLHRLIEILPSRISQIDCYYSLTFDKDIIQYEDYGIDVLKSFGDSTNFYDNIVDCIEWLIKEDYLKKEYLEQ